MMLLERDPVLASLRQYAHEAGRGEGRLVLIAGEAGEEILPATTLIGIILLWMSAIFTIYTGWDYFRAGIHHLIKEDEA